jgi:hypothetical protein
MTTSKLFVSNHLYEKQFKQQVKDLCIKYTVLQLAYIHQQYSVPTNIFRLAIQYQQETFSSSSRSIHNRNSVLTSNTSSAWIPTPPPSNLQFGCVQNLVAAAPQHEQNLSSKNLEEATGSVIVATGSGKRYLLQGVIRSLRWDCMAYLSLPKRPLPPSPCASSIPSSRIAMSAAPGPILPMAALLNLPCLKSQRG